LEVTCGFKHCWDMVPMRAPGAIFGRMSLQNAVILCDFWWNHWVHSTATGWPLILLGLGISRYIHIPELQHDGHFGVSDGDRCDRGALILSKKNTSRRSNQGPI
jgi:hypothetical protein